MLSVKDNAESELASPLSQGATTASCVTGDGSKFSASNFILTICDPAAGSNLEKVLVSSRSGDTFTISQRGYGGTSDIAHNTGSIIYQGTIQHLVEELQAQFNVSTGHDHDGTDSKKADWSNLDNKPSTFTPSSHKTTHQTGGSDEISIAGLSGEAADKQKPEISGLTATTDAPDGANDFIPIYDNSAAGNRKIKFDDAAKRKQTMLLTGVGSCPSKTNGAIAQAMIEMPTNKQTLLLPAFPDGATKSVEWDVIVPDSYDGGTVKFKVYWTANSTSANSVKWGLKARAYGDDDALDQAYGTEVTITDANKSTAFDLNISDESEALSIGGTPAGGKLLHFCLSRLGADAADTLTVDAYLIGVLLEFGTNKWSD